MNVGYVSYENAVREWAVLAELMGEALEKFRVFAANNEKHCRSDGEFTIRSLAARERRSKAWARLEIIRGLKSGEFVEVRQIRGKRGRPERLYGMRQQEEESTQRLAA